jgi:hypothetical protein
MKLFIYVPYLRYTYGSTIVAANDRTEADNIIGNGNLRTSVSFSRIVEGITVSGEPRIIEDTSEQE